MEDIAGWIAPAATMIAAMMTAANLGARFTGWGFVVFVVGSVAWVIVGATTGQQNLLLSNGFLTIVNLVGIWRWLGREAKYGDGAQAAQEKSHAEDGPAIFPIGGIGGCEIKGRDGSTIGRVAGAMAECGSGRVSYLVIAEGGVGGVGERLHAISWGAFSIEGATVHVDHDASSIAALPQIEADRWPARAPAA